MLGALAISSSVNSHWEGGVCDVRWGLDGAAGDGALLRDNGRGGDVLELWDGGDGTAGGTSRLRVGDFEADAGMAALGNGFAGRVGGW